jgi:ABC-type cobalamin/Fe3+-siderophores transport system ATPase subunit
VAKITIDNVRKTYGPWRFLHGVSAKAEDGEFVVLVGPAGCGKSTLLRMIARLESISSGIVRIGDRVVMAAFAFPSPNTVCVARLYRSHAVHVAAACRSFSSTVSRLRDAMTFSSPVNRLQSGCRVRLRESLDSPAHPGL